LIIGMDDFALPLSVSEESRSNLIERFGKFSLQKIVRDSSQRLFRAPPIHLLSASVPEEDPILQIADHHGSKVEDLRLFPKLLFGISSLSDIHDRAYDHSALVGLKRS